MRKQVDFAVHVATLGSNVANGAMSSEQFTQFIKSRGHFGDGWEVVGPAQFIQNTADGISVLITMVKYEDLPGVDNAKPSVEEVAAKRGPGRPPKSAETDAG